MTANRLATGLALVLFGLAISHAGAISLPATRQPSDCTIAPMAIGDLQNLVAAGASSAATPGPSQTVTPELTANIKGTIEESVACTNANEPLRALALFTDGYLVVRFSGVGSDDLGHLAAAVTRDPAPAEPADQLAILTIGDPKMLDDGRVSVIVETSNASQDFADVLILAKVGDLWLIDETHSAMPNSSTPTPLG